MAKQRKTNPGKKALREHVNRFIEEQKKPFDLDSALETIVAPLCLDSLKKNMADIATLIIEDKRLFVGERRCVPRAHYFRGAKFRMMPTPAEVEEGILYPGHRFMPFLSPQIDPINATVVWNDTIVPTRTATAPIMDILIYHSLSGFAAVLPNLPEKELAKFGKALSAGKNPMITLPVFDMAEFYAAHDFQSGDTMILTVADWTQGRFRMEHCPQTERNQDFNQANRWCLELQANLTAVFDMYGPHLNANEQLALAFYLGDHRLKSKPEMHIGGFLGWSKVVGIAQAGMEACLWYKDENPLEAFDLSSSKLQENTGSTESLDDILTDIGVSLCAGEIEAYMRDELYCGRRDLIEVTKRCFHSRMLEFYNEKQEKAFARFMTTMWTDVQRSYNRDDDRFCGPVRSRLLRLTDTQIAWLRKLDARGQDVNSLPKQQFLELAQGFSLITSIVVALNDVVTTDEATVATLSSHIDQMEESLRQMLSDLDAEL